MERTQLSCVQPPFHSSTKGAIVAFTRSLSQQLAPRVSGLRVAQLLSRRSVLCQGLSWLSCTVPRAVAAALRALQLHPAALRSCHVLPQPALLQLWGRCSSSSGVNTIRSEPPSCRPAHLSAGHPCERRGRRPGE